MAFAVYGMAVVLAPAIGPTLGGYITDNFSWRWIFFINVPVGIVSLLLTPSAGRGSAVRARRQGARPAASTTSASRSSRRARRLQVVLDKGQRDDWFALAASSLVMVVASVAAIVASIVLGAARTSTRSSSCACSRTATSPSPT